jgi:hypothetical protein
MSCVGKLLIPEMEPYLIFLARLTAGIKVPVFKATGIVEYTAVIGLFVATAVGVTRIAK